MHRALPEGAEMPRPISPNAQRRVKWARVRGPSATVRQVPADDKFQCQRALLAPHAGLVLRYDGALLRVIGVHKFGSDAHCTVDLVGADPHDAPLILHPNSLHSTSFSPSYSSPSYTATWPRCAGTMS